MMNFTVKRNIIIWGMGEYAKITYEMFENIEKVNVKGFADNNYEKYNSRIGYGENINGILDAEIEYHVVFSPVQVKNMFEKGEIDGVVIGTSWMYYKEIKKQLEQECITVIEVPDYCWISASDIAKGIVYKEENGIRAYKINNIIFRKVGTGNIVSYTKDKKVIVDECNGYTSFVFKMFLPSVNKDILIIEEEVCSLARRWGDVNYSHFLLEILPKIIMLEKNEYQGKYLLQKTKWAEEILNIIEVRPERILWIDDLPQTFLIKNNVCIEGSAMRDVCNIKQLSEWASGMREKIMNSSVDGSEYPKRIYVKRIGKRRLENVDNLLHKYNFYEMIPENYSVLEQWRYFMSADVVLVPHGAASSNCIFLKENSSVIETFPKEWICTCFSEVYMQSKVRYHAVPENSACLGDKIYCFGANIESYIVDKNILELAIRDSIG